MYYSASWQSYLLMTLWHCHWPSDKWHQWQVTKEHLIGLVRSHCARLIGGCAPTVPNPNSVSWSFCQAKIVDISPSIVNSKLFCQLSKSDLDQDNLPGTITLRIMETNHLPATMCKLPISIPISLFHLTGRRTLSDSPTFFFIWILSIFGATQYWSHSLYVFRWQLFAKLISASCLVLVLRRWQGYVLLSSNVENMAVISKKKRVENKGFAAWGICYNCSTEFFIFSVIFWQSLHSFPTPNRGGK